MRFHNYCLCRTVHDVTLEHETRWHTNLPPGLFLIDLFLSSNSSIGNGRRFFQLSLSGARPSVVGSSQPLHAICVTFPQILIPAHAKGTLSEGDIAPPLSKRRARPTVLELSWVKGAVGDPSTAAQLEWCHLLWRPPWFRPSGCFHPLASCHLARVFSACSKLVSAFRFKLAALGPVEFLPRRCTQKSLDFDCLFCIVSLPFSHMAMLLQSSGQSEKSHFYLEKSVFKS